MIHRRPASRLVNDPVPREAPSSQGRLRFRLALACMAFVTLALAAIFGRHGLLDVQRYRAERDRLRAEIAALELEQARLEAEVATLKRDPAALERVAREELGLGRPGEALILLPRTAAAAEP